MLGPGECPILRLRNFSFTVLSILVQLTSDPFSFLWWSSTTKVLNRYQPPMRMKVRLCEDVNTGYSDLISRGPAKITENFSLAETKSLLNSMTPSTESLRRTAGPSLCSHFLPSTHLPFPWTMAFRRFHSSETQVLSGDIWVFTSITSLGGVLQPKRKLTCSFPTKSSSTLIFYRKWKKRKKKAKY